MVEAMNHKVLLVCWSLRPIHGTLLHALSEALGRMNRPCGFLGRPESAPSGAGNVEVFLACTSVFELISLIFRGELRGFDVVYLQSTHPLNVCVSLWAKLQRLKIAYYLHEPTGFFEKISKGDPTIYSALVRLTQILECWFADVVFVATVPLIEQAHRLHLARADRILCLPLAIPDLVPSPRPEPRLRNRLLYLGRAHPMRCLDRFAELADRLKASGLGLQPTMLTYSPVPSPSAFVDTRAGRSYSDEEMLELLEESIAVWNVYNVEYSQSGVTPVALRSGVPLLVSRFEKETSLVEQGVAFEVPLDPFNLEELHGLLQRLKDDFNPISAKCLDYFQRSYAPQSLIPYLEKASVFGSTQGLQG